MDVLTLIIIMVIISQYTHISHHYVYTFNSHNDICQLYLNEAEKYFILVEKYEIL